MNRWILTALIFLVIGQYAFAQPLHLPLLAVQDVNGTLIGSTADLYLEIQPGRGRVFLETFPLTKIDTQISTRFAKEIACNYFDLSCSASDFIYTIQSRSNIIGGPSAGAALAALTTAGLLNLAINENVAVTGTINSGGLVGPVSGIKQKIDAADSVNMQKVLIPFGTRIIENGSLDLAEYGREKGIEVLEVSDLNDVVFHLTSKRLLFDPPLVAPDPEYTMFMEDISSDLCRRTRELLQSMPSLNKTETTDITNRSQRIESAVASKAYYSAASYCFGLNIKLRNLAYQNLSLSEGQIDAKALSLRHDITRLEKNARSRELTTITDLQARSIVLERLHDAAALLDRMDTEDGKKFLLAFAEERYYSAVVWARLFDVSGHTYTLNEDVLKRSCIEKIQEARERYQYIAVIFPLGVEDTQQDIERAEKYAAEEEYELCLIQASEAKAQAHAFVSTIGVEDDGLDKLVQHKLDALNKLISRTIEKRAFPVLGYSYYEYAQSLRMDEPTLALLYSEYGLELSNLDIYFEERSALVAAPSLLPTSRTIGLVLLGIGTGIGFAAVFFMFARGK